MKEIFNYYEFIKAGEKITKYIAEYLDKLRLKKVKPQKKFGVLKKLYEKDFPEDGKTIEKILKEFDENILPFVTNWNHPNFFSYFNSTSNSPGILAEYIIAALNSNSMHWDSNPAGTELEMAVLEWLKKALGINDDFFALTYDTASISTFHALAAAREHLSEYDFRKKGILTDKFSKGIVCYCSELAHSSVEKDALILGFGEEGIKKIEVDQRYSIDILKLENEIKKDIASGKLPICVVATIGGTAFGSVDNIKEIVKICRKYNLWLHIDAAWAGACALSPKYKKYFDSWNEADSIVVNPHKWLFIPFDCSVLFVRNKKALASAFSLTPSYLQSADYHSINFMDYSLPLGRKFRALKMFFVFKYFGFKNIENMIEENISLAALFADMIKNDENFTLFEPQNFALVCFRLNEKYFPDDKSNQELVRIINDGGDFFISSAKFRNKTYLRVSISSPYITYANVKSLYNKLSELAKELKKKH